MRFFCPEKGSLCVRLLWLVLCVVALPISDGLQPPCQGLYDAHLLLNQPKYHSKPDFTGKIVVTYFQAL
jgi:hypothetical protein